jgi:flagellin-specific chaperone FliS
VITACDRAELAHRDRGQQWLQIFHDEMVRAQAILLELTAGLAVQHANHEVALLSKHLESLYGYGIRELVRANTQKSPEPIAAVRMVVSKLLDAWVTSVR